MRIPPTLAALLLASALALGACGGGSSDGSDGAERSASTTSKPAGEGQTTVDIADFAYAPADLEVNAGDTVTFRNSDDATHTATADGDAPDGFDTGDIAGGDSAEVTFDQTGDYAYSCSIHEYMKGTVRVIG